MDLWARGVISLIDSKGDVSTGPDWAGDGPYNELSLSWRGKNSGWTARGVYGGAGASNGYISDYKIFFRFCDDAVKVTVGKPSISDYRIGSYIDDTGYGSRIFRGEYGFLVQAFPARGLSIAGGLQVPPETTTASEVYDNFRAAVSYKIDSIGKFNLGYLHDVDRQIFASTDLKLFNPVGILLGFRGYNDGSGVRYAYGSGMVPFGPMNVYVDLLGRFAEDFRYEAGTFFSYSRPAFSVGSSLWWVSVTRKVGFTPFFSAKVPNGFIRLGFRWSYAYVGDVLAWSVPVTYDLSF